MAAAPMVPASPATRPFRQVGPIRQVGPFRRAAGGLTLALILAASLAACGSKDDGATATGGTVAPLDGTSAPASTAGGSPASSTTAPPAEGPATTAPAAGATASTAAGAAIDTVPEADVAEMERTLDDIDQVLDDLDADFNQDQD